MSGPRFSANEICAQVWGDEHPGQNACVYCWAPGDQRDHVIPRSKGGAVALWNEVPACGACNGSKGARTPAQWIDDAVGNYLKAELASALQSHPEERDYNVRWVGIAISKMFESKLEDRAWLVLDEIANPRPGGDRYESMFPQIISALDVWVRGIEEGAGDDVEESGS